jgi:hypothetical protein
MDRLAVACLAALLGIAAAPAQAAPSITLEQAMAEPDWIGAPVENPYWGLDGKSVYYDLKRSGSPVRDRHRIDLGDGRDTVVEPAAMANADGGDAVYDRSRTRDAFERTADELTARIGFLIEAIEPTTPWEVTERA